MDKITEVSNKFIQDSELLNLCARQKKSLEQASDLIRKLNAEIAVLKVTSHNDNLKGTEQIICEVQIELLREVALTRQLTLEETKRLDLLVKNLLLLKGALKDIKPDYRTIPRGLTSDSLLAIASSSVGDV